MNSGLMGLFWVKIDDIFPKAHELLQRPPLLLPPWKGGPASSGKSVQHCREMLGLEMIFIPKDFDDEFLFFHFGAYILETIFF